MTRPSCTSTAEQAPAAVQGFRTLDCASKVRVHYLLPRALDEAFVEAFAGDDVTWRRFSELVAGAKDQFEIRRGSELRVAGVVGDARLTATFGKSNGAAQAEAIVAGFEQVLAGLFGRVVTQAAP